MIKIKGIEKPDRLIIFDLDDTLVRTDAKIKILKKGSPDVIKELTSEFLFDISFSKTTSDWLN